MTAMNCLTKYLKEMLKQNSFSHYTILVLIALFTSQFSFGQFNIPEKPAINTSVYDYAKILTSSQASYLEQKLIKYADSTSTQIVIASIKSLNGKDISLTATNWAHKWGIGDKEKDNGIFILVASEDRQIDIATGYGIEHILSDLMTERILNRILLPEFKRGDYFSGLNKGTDAIIAALNGEFEADEKKNDKSGFPAGLTLLLCAMFFVFILSLIAKYKDDDDDYKGRKRKKGLSSFETIILSSGGRSYGSSTGSFDGGGYSGGGGFSGGFGGGGFGGGGASGSW